MGTNDQFLTIFYGLEILLPAFLGFILLLQVRLNGFVLGIEVAQILRLRGRRKKGQILPTALSILIYAISWTLTTSLSCDVSQTLCLWHGYVPRLQKLNVKYG